MTSRSDFLGSEKVGKLLFSFSLPAFLGMFASGNGKEYDEYVQFSYFMYKEKE